MILVIGGAGFIGSNLCKRLKEDGEDVISLDNYSTGLRSNHVEGVRYIDGVNIENKVNNYGMELKKIKIKK